MRKIAQPDDRPYSFRDSKKFKGSKTRSSATAERQRVSYTRLSRLTH